MFATILLARPQQDDISSAERQRSSSSEEIERALRACTQKLRIVSCLTGGAHCLLPGIDDVGTTVAVRVYTPQDIAQFQKELDRSQSANKNNVSIPCHLLTRGDGGGVVAEEQSDVIIKSDEKIDQQELSNEHFHEQDVDNLQCFRDAFKYTVVFFVLPPGPMQLEQLRTSTTFVMRAQRLLVRPSKKCNRTTTMKGGSACYKEKGDQGVHSQVSIGRSYIVPDIPSAIRALQSFIESIKPAKMEMKKKFFEQESKRIGLVAVRDMVTSIPGVQSSSNRHHHSDAFAKQSAAAFRSWAERAGHNGGDADVVLSLLGSMSKVVTATPAMLEGVPVDESFKQAVMEFFNANHECITKTAADRESGGSLMDVQDNDNSDSINNYSPKEHSHNGGMIGIFSKSEIQTLEPGSVPNSNRVRLPNSGTCDVGVSEISLSAPMWSQFKPPQYGGKVDFTPIQPYPLASESAMNQGSGIGAAHGLNWCNLPRQQSSMQSLSRQPGHPMRPQSNQNQPNGNHHRSRMAQNGMFMQQHQQAHFMQHNETGRLGCEMNGVSTWNHSTAGSELPSTLGSFACNLSNGRQGSETTMFQSSPWSRGRVGKKRPHRLPLPRRGASSRGIVYGSKSLGGY